MTTQLTAEALLDGEDELRLCPIIAIYSARSGVGKTTLAQALSDELDAPVRSFAAPVKECEITMLDVLFPEFDIARVRRLSRARAFEHIERMVGSKDAELSRLRGSTRRQIQLGIGEGLRQFVSPNIFCWIMEQELFIAADEGYPYVIIDDLRNPQELDFLRTVPGSVVVALHGDPYIPSTNTHMEGLLDELLKPDLIVANTASPQDNAKHIHTWLKQHSEHING